MNETERAHFTEAPATATATPAPAASSAIPRGLWIVIAALVLGFSVPLVGLVQFALGSELYSHVVLIPVVSAFLIWINRHRLPAARGEPNRALAAMLAAGGAAALAAYWLPRISGGSFDTVDALSLATFSFVLFVDAACAWFLDRARLRSIAFPLGFLLCTVPLPIDATNAVETFLQKGSAPVAYTFFKVVGTPVFKQDLIFQLPGISLYIAPECSGIHSTLALFITSLVAGYLFLRSPGRRAVLAFAVIPLALLRNGFRVFTIGELCVQIGPHMIDSYIHRKGGPIFFVISLVPFFVLLLYLMKSERRRASGNSPTPAPLS
jgi:exosortase C (VPDSG-CTERM-specific)